MSKKYGKGRKREQKKSKKLWECVAKRMREIYHPSNEKK